MIFQMNLVNLHNNPNTFTGVGGEGAKNYLPKEGGWRRKCMQRTGGGGQGLNPGPTTY